MNFKFISGLMLAGVVALSSCTIKDSDEPKAGEGRLVGISAMSMQFLSLTYNNEGKVTQLADAFTGTKVTIDYSAKSIEMLEYDDYSEWDEDAEDYIEKIYLENKTTWKNCVFDSNGYIKSADATEIDYDRDGNVMGQDAYPISFSYSPNGNITQFVIKDAQGDEITNYEWRDGLLNKVSWEDGYVNYNYYMDGPDNYNRQWVPWWGNGDPSFLAMTGILGVAPVKLVTNTYMKDRSDTERMEYYYSLTESGYIAAMRTSGEAEYTFNFNYVKTKSQDEPMTLASNHKKSGFNMFRKKRK